MNIAHTDGKKSYPGTAGILNITPETVSSQLLSWTRYFFHNYFNGLNTAVNTSYAWLDNIDYGLNKHTMCTVSQSTAQLFWLSPQSFKCWQLLERSLIGFYIAYLCSSYLLFKEEWSEECCIFGFFFQAFSSSHPAKDLFRACSPSDAFSIISQYFNTACKRSPTFQSLSRSLLES